MPFVYEGWTLYARAVQLKRGPKVTIYFFAKRKPRRGRPVDLPAGFEFATNKRTGLPYLRKARSSRKLSRETMEKVLDGEEDVLDQLDE
jgi:hypothetical protein